MKREIKRTLTVAAPIILGNVTQMALGLLDSAMVGSIDYKQLAAASLVTNVLAIPYVAGIGMTMSLSPLVAIANGKKDAHAASHYLFNGLILCTIVAIVIAAGIHCFHNVIHHMGQDPEVVALAIPYLKIMGWSTVPMLIFLSMKSFTDALEHTKVAMTLSLLSLPIDAFLNWVFIFGKLGFPRLEIEGAAWTTLVTRTMITIALFTVILRGSKFKAYMAERQSAWKLKAATFKELLMIGIPSSVQYGLEVGAFSISGLMIGWFGATQQAAHQIALNLASTSFMIIMGISTAGSIRISNALGRNHWASLKDIGYSTLAFGTGLGVFFALIFIGLHNYLPLIFNQDPAVVSLAAHLLLFAALFQISDATQAIGVGLLRGIKDVRMPTFFVALAYWIIGIPLGYFLGVYFDMKATGMWIGLVCGLTASSLLLNFRFRRLVRRNTSAVA